MQKKEIIGILIAVVLIIILAVSVWFSQIPTKKVKINCQTLCMQTGRGEWFFPGVVPVSKNKFSTKEECISACNIRFQESVKK
jgi:hypothetical protein